MESQNFIMKYTSFYFCVHQTLKKKEKEKNANWFHQFSSTLMQELGRKKYSNKMFIVMLNQKGFRCVEMDTIKTVLNLKDFEPRFLPNIE